MSVEPSPTKPALSAGALPPLSRGGDVRRVGGATNDVFRCSRPNTPASSRGFGYREPFQVEGPFLSAGSSLQDDSTAPAPWPSLDPRRGRRWTRPNQPGSSPFNQEPAVGVVCGARAVRPMLPEHHAVGGRNRRFPAPTEPDDRSPNPPETTPRVPPARGKSANKPESGVETRPFCPLRRGVLSPPSRPTLVGRAASLPSVKRGFPCLMNGRELSRPPPSLFGGSASESPRPPGQPGKPRPLPFPTFTNDSPRPEVLECLAACHRVIPPCMAPSRCLGRFQPTYTAAPVPLDSTTDTLRSRSYFSFSFCSAPGGCSPSVADSETSVENCCEFVLWRSLTSRFPSRPRVQVFSIARASYTGDFAGPAHVPTGPAGGSSCPPTVYTGPRSCSRICVVVFPADPPASLFSRERFLEDVCPISSSPSRPGETTTPRGWKSVPFGFDPLPAVPGLREGGLRSPA